MARRCSFQRCDRLKEELYVPGSKSKMKFWIGNRIRSKITIYELDSYS